MASAPSQPPRPSADYPDRISRQTFEQLVSVRGEGDEWDFKATLGNPATTSARVNLAKDALAFCNLPAGGTIIVGVTDDYERVGLKAAEKIDTTVIRRAIEKYIDGDFIVVAAEHTPGRVRRERGEAVRNHPLPASLRSARAGSAGWPDHERQAAALPLR